jgi:glucokinase
MTGSPTWDRPWLVADVGGTNIRFGLVTVRHGRPHTVRVMPLRDHLDLADAVETYLANFGHHGRPAAACVAVAGPVQGDRFRMTNGSWDISVEESRRRLGFERLELLNDLAALALAVPHLAEADARRIGDAATTARLGTASEPISQPEPVAVVGCGTGLGVAGLRWCDDRWAPIAGEGGHVDPPIVDDLEAEGHAHSSGRARACHGRVRVVRARAQPAPPQSRRRPRPTRNSPQRSGDLRG